jgi:hypothetical protein
MSVDPEHATLFVQLVVVDIDHGFEIIAPELGFQL